MIRKFWNDKRGASAIEYGLIAMIISLAILAGAGLVGNEVGDAFDRTANALEEAGN